MDFKLITDEPARMSKPSHDTIEFNTISVVDPQGVRRYFRLWGHVRNRVVECNESGGAIRPNEPVGYLKDWKATNPHSKNNWAIDLVNVRKSRDVVPYGLGKTRMEAVRDFCEWHVSRPEAAVVAAE